MKTWYLEYCNSDEKKYYTQAKLNNKDSAVYIFFNISYPGMFRIQIFDREYDNGGTCVLDNYFRLGIEGVELESDGCRLSALMDIGGIRSLERSITKIALERLVREL